MQSLYLLLFCVALSTVATGDYPDFGWDVTTPLDEYVHRDDGAWSWEIIHTYEYPDSNVYIVNMTSQYWMAQEGDDFATRQLWWHTMGVSIPKNIANVEYAGLFISSGNNNNPDGIPSIDERHNVLISNFSRDSGCVGAYIRQVPNQPCVFRDDPLQMSRTEDDIIAYSWRWWMDRTEAGEAPPDDVILRMPMTKAAKRALDTTNAVANELAGTNPQSFIVSGISKRGWTTWSLAATDQRVKFAVPLVMSLLKFEETLMSHYRSFEGGWSWAFAPYYRENLTMYFDDPLATEGVFNFEDMFRYRSRLAEIPKLMVSATGDEFFLCDDSHNFWDDLEGPKWMLMLPNTQHGMDPNRPRIYSTVLGFFTNYLDGIPVPELTWERSEGEGDGKIILRTDTVPDNVRGLRAVTLESNNRRDFRLWGGMPPDTQDIPWDETSVTSISDTEFEYIEDTVDDEWVGFFIETTYTSSRGFEMRLTSEVQIIPDEYPVEPCYGTDCYGYLT